MRFVCRLYYSLVTIYFVFTVFILYNFILYIFTGYTIKNLQIFIINNNKKKKK